ncbi:TM2 domain-containing protein [Georgenia sp. 10Sc9-8]|uniref:TM2 domain-containing protein n=1 Tax=Georgenia halotolerans TaxID=3028317 RepID=A0ABT5TWP9_9MICO|nr:TM2 domain-containing protein [Georgenia halotolerans]
MTKPTGEAAMSQPEYPPEGYGPTPDRSGHQGYGQSGGTEYQGFVPPGGYGYPSYPQPGGAGTSGYQRYGAGPADHAQPGWQGGPQYAQPYPGPYGYADPYAKSRLAAGLLGIFLGGLGIHRFYLGHVGIGIVQLLVTVVTAGFGAIWGFVEGILYLTARTGTFSRDASGRPLRS